MWLRIALVLSPNPRSVGLYGVNSHHMAEQPVHPGYLALGI